MRKLVRATGVAAGILGGFAVALTGIATCTTPFKDWPAFSTRGQRLVASYSYFTLWSNMLGAVVGAAYATNNRSSRWAWARIDAVVMLIITGIIYNTILAKDSNPTGLYSLTNPITHGVMPVIVPLLWLIDRFIATEGDVTVRNAFYAMALPVLWSGWTFYRGAKTEGYYPYAFLDVTKLGSKVVARNIAGITVSFVGLIGALGAAEKLIMR